MHISHKDITETQTEISRLPWHKPHLENQMILEQFSTYVFYSSFFLKKKNVPEPQQ